VASGVIWKVREAAGRVPATGSNASGPAVLARTASFSSRATTFQVLSPVLVNDRLIWCAFPRASYMVIWVWTPVPLAAALDRLPTTAPVSVSVGCMTSPNGTVSCRIGPLVLTTPSVAIQPWSSAPSGVTRLPAPS
jgi:hypothetical protein